MKVLFWREGETVSGYRSIFKREEEHKREQGHRLELGHMLEQGLGRKLELEHRLELGHKLEQGLGRMLEQVPEHKLEQGLGHKRGLWGRNGASQARGMGLPRI